MKNVPRLTTEPVDLAAYRAANRADAASAGPDAGPAWERFRGNPAYGLVREQLVRLQQGLCGYCEQRLTRTNGMLEQDNQQIEHVLAKTRGQGRTLDVLNFMLCCSGGTYHEKDPKYHDPVRHYQGDQGVSCGQSKADRDLDRGCDPRTFPCTPRLVTVLLDGRLQADEAACMSVDIDPGELNHTINNILNLNCDRLKLARAERRRLVTKEVVFLGEELRLRTEHPEADQLIGELLAELRLAPDTHGHLRGFWSIDRECIGVWAEMWIAKNTNRLGCP